ncbi:hypothetical protein [Agromyces silvae]|uniref:hypothetical protein n=1 Tax=Agromyces silvae TaxID=3388266 RepID=UPI00280A4FD5|nr:hypothetical protein [Agromyces protaetiae]
MVSVLATASGVSVPAIAAEPRTDATIEEAAGHEVPAPATDVSAAESSTSAAAAVLPSSAGVTVAGGNSVAVDVLGVGYEQVVRLNGSRVEVAEPVTRGGAVVRSFEVGASQAWPRLWDIPMFYGGVNMADRVTGHSASRVAVAGGFIYVSNLRTKDGGPFVPKVVDGSVVRKYTPDGVQVGERVFPGVFAVTSLAGFEHEGKPYLAIGLNYSGVRIADPTVPWLPDVHALMEHFKGPDRFGSLPTNERDQITELGFGVVGGRVQLMVGVLTGDMPALLAFDANTGQELWTKNLRPNDPARFEWPQEVEFSPYEVNGRVQIAVGWPTLGRLSFMDAVDGTDRGDIEGGVVGTVRFFTEASGEPRVGYRHGRAEGWSSHVAKHDPAGRPVVIENGAERDLEWMVPGYRAWSVQIENRSRSEVALRTFASPTRAEGCWRNTQLGGAAAPLPAQLTKIPVGSSAGPFATAQVTFGDSCGDNPGLFYAQLEAVGESGHRQVVQFQAEKYTVSVKDQVGTGRLVAHVEPVGLHGFRIVIANRHAVPTILDAPTIEASRLTPAPVDAVPTSSPDDPSRPVYRFAVSGTAWQVPGATADLTSVTLPLPVAEGSVDGVTWNALGTLASPLTPTLEGERVTLGHSVFDWQTSPDAKRDYRYFRVVVGGRTSAVVDAHALEAPPATTQVARPNLSGTGTPRANGLDQAPMRVTLLNSSSQGLDTETHADLYRRIYFRDPSTESLITGLGDPADPNQLVMFSLQPGQYANEGLSAAAGSSIGVSFSMKSTQQNRQVKALLRTDGAKTAPPSHSLPLRPMANTLLTDGTGAGGLAVGSCDERGWDPCALMDPAAGAALHSLTGTTVSVQFRTIALPGTASLPLAQQDHVAEQLRLVSDRLLYDGTRALLSNPNQFGQYAAITTDLIARGQRVLVENHPSKVK